MLLRYLYDKRRGNQGLYVFMLNVYRRGSRRRQKFVLPRKFVLAQNKKPPNVETRKQFSRSL